MLTRLLVFTLLGFGQLMLPSCGTQPEPAKKELYQKMLVGSIASVRHSSKYVLVQRFGRLNIAPGSYLYALDHAGKFHTLTFSGEMLGQFLAFDSNETAILKPGLAVYSSDTDLEKAQPHKTL